MAFLESGTTRLSVGGTVFSATKPVRIFSVLVAGVHGGAATGAAVTLYNGSTASTANAYAYVTAGNIRLGLANFNNGLLFPSGCTLLTNTAIDYVTISGCIEE